MNNYHDKRLYSLPKKKLVGKNAMGRVVKFCTDCTFVNELYSH